MSVCAETPVLFDIFPPVDECDKSDESSAGPFC